jgi:hypothetical protein
MSKEQGKGFLILLVVAADDFQIFIFALLGDLRPSFDAEAVEDAIVQGAGGKRHEVPKDVIAMPVTGGLSEELHELCPVLWGRKCQGW